MVELSQRAHIARIEHQRITQAICDPLIVDIDLGKYRELMHEMHEIGEELLKRWYESLPGEQSACVEVYLYLLEANDLP